ncbi:superoxide dismutase [Amycolatopsis roodepoortensis]|uniref:Superoxide dismutase n=1 Tax=Amycolatopsis roodepoortensis TaxID=700274 RepID=A0ABR9LAZ9_9PSEU|nr:superoxide dismutase [Amycolatopsis roodepoortensis]MBE1577710.1 Fe-Mn family superoxide dismutase [Amycolatopsis roodepoortensis]
MPVYTLPDLPYDYPALEPYISGRIMELHHDKHHAAYVAGANAALEQLASAREAGDFAAVNLHEKNLAFNLGGHTNHSVFWENLSPDGGGEPEGELLEAFKEQFGSFTSFQEHFSATAAGIQGSGWAVLGWDSIGQRMSVFQLFDQQSNVPAGIIPLFMLDMWEHAYYLDYLNVKADYIEAAWNIADWTNVAIRWDRARVAATGLIIKE